MFTQNEGLPLAFHLISLSVFTVSLPRQKENDALPERNLPKFPPIFLVAAAFSPAFRIASCHLPPQSKMPVG